MFKYDRTVIFLEKSRFLCNMKQIQFVSRWRENRSLHEENTEEENNSYVVFELNK
jgi:hypothetical protein